MFLAGDHQVNTNTTGVWCCLNAVQELQTEAADPRVLTAAVDPLRRSVCVLWAGCLCCCDLLLYEWLWNCLRASVWRNTVCKHSVLMERRCDVIQWTHALVLKLHQHVHHFDFPFPKVQIMLKYTWFHEFTLTYNKSKGYAYLSCCLRGGLRPIRANLMTCMMSSRRRN